MAAFRGTGAGVAPHPLGVGVEEEVPPYLGGVGEGADHHQGVGEGVEGAGVPLPEEGVVGEGVVGVHPQGSPLRPPQYPATPGGQTENMELNTTNSKTVSY